MITDVLSFMQDIKKTPNLILIRIETKKLPRYHSNSRWENVHFLLIRVKKPISLHCNGWIPAIPTVSSACYSKASSNIINNCFAPTSNSLNVLNILLFLIIVFKSFTIMTIYHKIFEVSTIKIENQGSYLL